MFRHVLQVKDEELILLRRQEEVVWVPPEEYLKPAKLFKDDALQESLMTSELKNEATVRRIRILADRWQPGKRRKVDEALENF